MTIASLSTSPALMVGSTSLAVEKFLFTRKEAAWAIGVSLRYLDLLLAAKKLAVRRIGSKVLIPRDELLRFTQTDHALLASL